MMLIEAILRHFSGVMSLLKSIIQFYVRKRLVCNNVWYNNPTGGLCGRPKHGFHQSYHVFLNDVYSTIAFAFMYDNTAWLSDIISILLFYVYTGLCILLWWHLFSIYDTIAIWPVLSISDWLCWAMETMHFAQLLPGKPTTLRKAVWSLRKNYVYYWFRCNVYAHATLYVTMLGCFCQ